MKIFRFIIPVVIIGLCAWKAKQWIDNKPEARRWTTPPATTFVDGTRVSSGDYQVIIRSQGTVKARTESTLIPEIAGVIVKVSPSFLDGGFFEKGVGRDQLPRLTVSTLGNTEIDPGVFERGRQRVVHALDGFDLLARHLLDRRDARTGCNTVDKHRARTAKADTAAEFCPVEF